MILITLPDGTLINISIGMAVAFALSFLGGLVWSLDKILARYQKD